jgi:hypothetical protein
MEDAIGAGGAVAALLVYTEYAKRGGAWYGRGIALVKSDCVGTE